MDRPGLRKTSGHPPADAARHACPPVDGRPHSRAAECPKSRALVCSQNREASAHGGAAARRAEAGGTTHVLADHDSASAPLRGGSVPRTLSPARTHARLSTVRALRRLGLSNQALAHYLGLASDRAGAELRFGARPLELGEALTLLPLEHAIDLVTALLRDRIDTTDPIGALARSHVDALSALAGLLRSAA